MLATYDRMRAMMFFLPHSKVRVKLATGAWLPLQQVAHFLQGQVKVCSLGAIHLLQGKV